MSSPTHTSEYLDHWFAAQTYETDAFQVAQEIAILQNKQARLLDMAQQHRHLMMTLIDVQE